MIYLMGIRVVNGKTIKNRHFKQLRIPFKNHREIEKFRFNRDEHQPEGTSVYINYQER